MRCLGVAPAYIRAPCGPMVKVIISVTEAIPPNQLLISWDRQVKMGILPEHFPNVKPKGLDKRRWRKEHRKVVEKLMNRMVKEETEKIKAVRTQVDEAPYPDTWPEAIKEVLEKYTPSVLTDELSEERRIHGPDMEIHLRDDASPFMTTSSPSISIHQEPIARKMMIDMVRAGVVRQVTADDPPSDWLSPTFFTPKPEQPDKLRLVTDFRHLNSQISRPVRCFATGEKIWRNVKWYSRYFLSMDCLAAYHQVKLSPAIRLLTRVSPPMGDL